MNSLFSVEFDLSKNDKKITKYTEAKILICYLEKFQSTNFGINPEHPMNQQKVIDKIQSKISRFYIQ